MWKNSYYLERYYARGHCPRRCQSTEAVAPVTPVLPLPVRLATVTVRDQGGRGETGGCAPSRTKCRNYQTSCPESWVHGKIHYRP